MWQLCCCNRNLKYRFRQFVGTATRYGYRGFQPGRIVAQYNTNDTSFTQNTWLDLAGQPISPPAIVAGDFVLLRARYSINSLNPNRQYSRLYRASTTTTNPSPPQTGVGFRDVSGPAFSHGQWAGSLPRFIHTLPPSTTVVAGTILITSGVAYLATVTYLTTGTPTAPQNDARWFRLGSFGAGWYWHAFGVEGLFGRYRYAEELTTLTVIVERRVSQQVYLASAFPVFPTVIVQDWSEAKRHTLTHRRRYALGISGEQMIEYESGGATEFPTELPSGGTFDIGRGYFYPFPPDFLTAFEQTVNSTTLVGETPFAAIGSQAISANPQPPLPWQDGDVFTTFHDTRYRVLINQSVTLEGADLEGRFRSAAGDIVSAIWGGSCSLPEVYASAWSNKYQFGPCLPAGRLRCVEAGDPLITSVSGSSLQIESNCHSTINGVSQGPGTFLLGNSETWCPDPTKPCNTPTP